MRNELVEIISRWDQSEPLVDHLLKNGVIAPPCKVGDVVYYIPPDKSQIRVMLVNQIFIDAGEKTIGDGGGIYFLFENFGKTVFLTKEEAEKALRG